MITIQHQETEKSGVFEAWMRATEEGACAEPVQVGEMTHQRPTSQRVIIDHTRVFDGFEGRGIARQMVLAAVDFARANNRKIIPVCSYAQALLTRTDEYQDILV
ncbi:MAG: N-acetyltransferase [Paludibacteraceae bacterium]|nr:N-acetyltransferase [Paludibacteraceae bacterium]MBR0195728.1 N-acetyltransferase [Paludibacteraceae bacterium]